MYNKKTLVLQITREDFYTILNGEQKIEHRYVYPSVWGKYFISDDEVVKLAQKEGVSLDDEKFYLNQDKFLRHYDTLVLINGRRKDSPRLEIKIEEIHVYLCENQKGEVLTFMHKGEEWQLRMIEISVGKLISCQNVDEKMYKGDKSLIQR